MIHRSVVYVNSARRVSGSSNCDFSYEIPMEHGSKLDTVAVLQASIPVSYYLIQKGYNTLQLEEGKEVVVLTVPEGNYSAGALSATLTSLFNTKSPNHWTYSVTFDNGYQGPLTGKFRWQVLGATETVTLIINDMAQQMGFNRGDQVVLDENGVESKNVINLMPESTVFIHSDLVSDKTNILQEIYVGNAAPFSYLTFQNPDPLFYSKPLSNTNSSIFHFWITDEDGVPLFLNGLNMELTLLLYERSKLDELMRLGLKTMVEVLSMKNSDDNVINDPEPEEPVEPEVMPEMAPEAKQEPEVPVPAEPSLPEAESAPAVPEEPIYPDVKESQANPPPLPPTVAETPNVPLETPIYPDVVRAKGTHYTRPPKIDIPRLKVPPTPPKIFSAPLLDNHDRDQERYASSSAAGYQLQEN